MLCVLKQFHFQEVRSACSELSGQITNYSALVQASKSNTSMHPSEQLALRAILMYCMEAVSIISDVIREVTGDAEVCERGATIKAVFLVGLTHNLLT